MTMGLKCCRSEIWWTGLRESQRGYLSSGCSTLSAFLFLCFWADSGYNSRRNAVHAVLDGFADTYAAIGADKGGMLATSHIHKIIVEAGERGVIWPGTLYVLMEDIDGRPKTM
ncbi:MAG: hypothetical protein KGJ57_09260 [Sphingomonadales bacterium]|nr:hypothetical protein [Sphingomonadales bacterium]MDE2169598.1 hypothetical protein [Sphingomonadales bacterium]